MTVCTADFETGVNGSNVTTSDTGSATAFNGTTLGTGSLTYDNTHPNSGSLGMKVVNASGGETAFSWSTAFGTQTDHYGRFYFYATANPASTWRPLVAWSSLNTTLGACVQINSTGKILGVDTGTAVTFTNAIALNQLIRVEYHFVHSATVGQIEIKLFNNASSSTPTETQTSTANRNTQANATAVTVGSASGGMSPMTAWFDNVVANATAYPGPFPVNTVAPAVTGSAPVGSTLTCDGGTWNGTFTLGYQWTRDGANISSATSSTYVTQAADSGHAIGCKVTATGQQATNESATQASGNTVTATSSSSSNPGADPSKTASFLTLSL